jgi:hypothetical protein
MENNIELTAGEVNGASAHSCYGVSLLAADGTPDMRVRCILIQQFSFVTYILYCS